jgi:plastocyanin
MSRFFFRLCATGALVAPLGCGSKPPTEPSGPPVATTTITITAAGANPKNVQINIGQRVLFINNDNRAHNMTSDPHPEHSDCIEINQVALLQPGQQRETSNLVQPKVCGFHDHDLPDNNGLKGTITIR